jgi:hypothetical protein
VPGYSESVRNVPERVKQEVYAVYGIVSRASGAYEVDHLIPLELGGDNSIGNLWPEASPGYHEKDRVENELHDAGCAGRVSLRTAQRQIARDWRRTAAGLPRVAPAPSLPAPAPSSPPPAPSLPTPAPSSGPAQLVHPGAFCAPEGAHGVTSRGTPMTCTTSATDPRARWRHSR